PGGDWPAGVASPGVWHRLMMQAALGLHAAPAVGVTHGRLTPNSFLLTRPGVVKLVGVGEPPWLHAGRAGQEATAEDDLKALGHGAARGRGGAPRAHADGAGPRAVGREERWRRAEGARPKAVPAGPDRHSPQ